MINSIINYTYLNNISDIISFCKDKSFINLLNKIDNTKIKIKNNLIQNKKIPTHEELFFFNLDNYISFIKNHLKINQLQVRYIIFLTLNNKNNKILYSKKYYYDNIEYFNKKYEDLFLYNYKKNYLFLKKYIDLKEHNFNELISIINNKKRSHAYFENINISNMSFYLPIIEVLENN